MKKWIYRHGPMIAMMTGIFIVSSDLGSADHTRPVLASLVRKFLPWLAAQMTPQMIDTTDFVIRKIAHVTEYAFLGLLVSRSLDTKWNSSLLHRILVASITSIYALSDEIHQSFVPSRGASYVDVLWDSLGAIIGSFIVWISGNLTPFTDPERRGQQRAEKPSLHT